MLEKMLRSLPEIKKIFVMIRPRKNVTIEERLISTIFSSEIFKRVWEEQPRLRAKILEKVKPIAGDLIIDKLGISPSDRAILRQEVNVIINSAASVNFDDPLLDAIQINYMGALKMQDLAFECENLAAHVHVSTAYVNCNRPGGLIEEKIFDLEGEDPEDIIAKIQNMNPQYITDNEKTLIGGYPNTYTYTKSMAERTFKKRCANLPAAIVRPSSITACLNEPFAGWTDTIAATGGMCLASGMGIIHYIKCSPDTIFDIIPADLVSNLVIAAAYFRA